MKSSQTPRWRPVTIAATAAVSVFAGGVFATPALALTPDFSVPFGYVDLDNDGYFVENPFDDVDDEPCFDFVGTIPVFTVQAAQPINTIQLQPCDFEIENSLDYIDSADLEGSPDYETSFDEVAEELLDCDDNNPDVNPGARERRGNGLDDDCNSETSDARRPTTDAVLRLNGLLDEESVDDLEIEDETGEESVLELSVDEDALFADEGDDDALMTRGEFAVALQRWMRQVGIDARPSEGDWFTDDDDTDYENELDLLAQNGIMIGNGSGLSNHGLLVSGFQARVMIDRALSLAGKSVGDDFPTLGASVTRADLLAALAASI